jgi:hypothetical protein
VEFLDRRQYAVAYEFWAKTGGNNLRRVQVGTIEDGGFESSHLSGEVGFAWRVNEVASFNVTIDNGAGANGKRSLRIDWKGNSDPAEEVVSQLILVEPNARYQLRFAARTQELVTGGAPVLTVTDISERNEKRIASSHTMPVGTSDWQYIHLDFTTASSTSAIRIGVQRESCPQHPCRIFGTLWLDDFSLSKI